MNKKQKIAFLVGIGIIVLMGLIPPWYYAFVGGPHRLLGAYGLLFSPPSLVGAEDLADVYIDLSRLLVQWAVVAIATAGIVLVLKDYNGRHGDEAPNDE